MGRETTAEVSKREEERAPSGDQRRRPREEEQRRTTNDRSVSGRRNQIEEPRSEELLPVLIDRWRRCSLAEEEQRGESGPSSDEIGDLHGPPFSSVKRDERRTH